MMLVLLFIPPPALNCMQGKNHILQQGVLRDLALQPHLLTAPILPRKANSGLTKLLLFG